MRYTFIFFLLLAGKGVDLITTHGGALNIVLDSPPNRYYDISFGSAKRSKVDKKKSTVFLINLSIYYIYGCIKIKDV